MPLPVALQGPAKPTSNRSGADASGFGAFVRCVDSRRSEVDANNSPKS